MEQMSAVIEQEITIEEIEEITDTDRLIWMIKNKAMCFEGKNGFWCEVIRNSNCKGFFAKSPREAIDYAIKNIHE